MSTRTRGILAFIGLSYAIAWILWEIPIRLGIGPGRTLFQLLSLPGAFGPAFAAIIVRRWVTREGFADAGLRLNLRGNRRYYLAAWLLPLPAVAAVVALAVLLGAGRPDFSLAQAVEALSPGVEAPTLPPVLALVAPVQLLVVALLATPILWGEEFGWRGYLQVRIFPGRPVLAAVATGVIWGLWHLPINLRGYNFPGHPALGMVVFTVSAVLLSIIFGWLRLRTRSVWSASLAHAATNSVGGSMLLLLFAGQEMLYLGYVGILAWVPLGATAAWIVFTGRLRAEPRTGAGPTASREN